MSALLNDDITPEQFAERLEAMAQRLRDDPDTIRFHRKPTRQGVASL
jgi:hypothetical protein